MRRKLLTAGVALLLLGIATEWCGAATMSEAKSWGYQLQNADPQQLAASNFDVIVMDYSRDGTDGTAYSAQEIQSIRSAGKIVLAYLSIGEAEDYRFYWKPSWKPGNPSWLGQENPDWKGNYKVKYWNAGWWTSAIAPYLKRIRAAGFDGVYMDIIDAYWYWHEEKGYKVSFTSLKMVELVEKIGKTNRSWSPKFILCPQNAESILDDVPKSSVRARYLAAINAIGIEDLFYHYGSSADQKYRIKLAGQYARAGKKVMNIEYIKRSLWNKYLGHICGAGYEVLPYGAMPDRALDELVDFPESSCPGESAAK